MTRAPPARTIMMNQVADTLLGQFMLGILPSH